MHSQSAVDVLLIFSIVISQSVVAVVAVCSCHLPFGSFSWCYLNCSTGNGDLGSEFYETLAKMAPTKEEELKLKDYNGDISKLDPAERFLKDVLDIPFAFKRIDAMLYRANFGTEVNYLKKSFGTLEVNVYDDLNFFILILCYKLLPLFKIIVHFSFCPESNFSNFD